MSFPHSPLSVRSRKLRVLIVDDEHAVADSLVMILNKSGLEALAAYSGLEALEALPAFRPHVAISDVMMPGMSGFELAYHLSEGLPLCKVLLMSGNDAALEAAERDLAKGTFAKVLSKPVRPQTILDLLAEYAEAPAVR